MHSDHMSMCEIFVGPGRTIFIHRPEFEALKYILTEEYDKTRDIMFAVGECMSHLNYLMFRDRIYREMVDGTWRYYAKEESK